MENNVNINSDFFNRNQINLTGNVYCAVKDKSMPLKEYANYKNVTNADLKNRDNDRSICQMARNANGMTKLNYNKQFTYIINFANNAVNELNNHNKSQSAALSTLIEGKPTPYVRSAFTEEKRALGIKYLQSPHHSIFGLLAEVYNKLNNSDHKKYIEEISYYMQRINKKLLEYEQSS